ncbi:hypothetical protein [Aneurinibacillus uraniidurans]|uniref:hypothetical protein n=1 Tax=Aneurinibacillus uraniidurans TaxID=2966586 RepID=UPI00234B3379|nr:hypothetical protein [Aneurinibacillus sp. B1]WCN36886.1 hypothetical protein PO771_13580 [Aneurinibacillus sp. B1]
MFEWLARIKSIAWLHEKCGVLLYGEKIICSSSGYYSSRSSIKLGRQRSSLPTKGKDTLGTEEVEYEAN